MVLVRTSCCCYCCCCCCCCRRCHNTATMREFVKNHFISTRRRCRRRRRRRRRVVQNGEKETPSVRYVASRRRSLGRMSSAHSARQIILWKTFFFWKLTSHTTEYSTSYTLWVKELKRDVSFFRLPHFVPSRARVFTHESSSHARGHGRRGE